MIILRNTALLVLLDPSHGAEISAVHDLASGRSILGTTPFAADAPRAGDLDEESWTRGYRGGWQLLTPNAGNVCRVGETAHGFHGRASNDPWTAVDQEETTVCLMWMGHGLRILRTVELVERVVRVRTHWESLDAPVPLVAAEHIAFGAQFLHPSADIEFEGGACYELSEETGPTSAPPSAPRWPRAQLRTGRIVDVRRVDLGEPKSRFLAVEDTGDRLTLRNATHGLAVTVTWDTDAMPHACLWNETRWSEGPWRGITELLIVEPGTVQHSLGLRAALADGQACWARPGAAFETSVALEIGEPAASPPVEAAGTASVSGNLTRLSN